MSKLSNKLTIILTLYGREDFTQRWLEYMNYHSCPYKIIIGDSKGDPFFDDPKNLSTNFPNLDCSYHRFDPSDSNHSNFNETNSDIEPLVYYFQDKLPTLFNLVETDYVLLDDNDNFYAIDDFEQYIEFLESDNNYVGSRGRADRFWLYKGMNISSINEPYGNKWIAFSMANFSIEHDSSIDRIDYLFSNVNQDHVLINWYSIYRTSVMKDVFDSLKKVDPLDLFASEALALALILNRGKIKVFDNTYFLQQHGASSSVEVIRETYPLPIRRMILQNRWNALYELVKDFNFNVSTQKRFLNSFSGMLEEHLTVIKNRADALNKRYNFSIKLPKIYFIFYKLYYFLDLYILKKKFIRPKQLNFLKKNTN